MISRRMSCFFSGSPGTMRGLEDVLKSHFQCRGLDSTAVPSISARKCPLLIVVGFPGEPGAVFAAFDTFKTILPKRAFLIERPGAYLTMPPVWVAEAIIGEVGVSPRPLLDLAGLASLS